MIDRLKLPLLIMMILGAVVLGGAQERQRPKPSFTIAITTPVSEIRVGTPVLLDITLTNTSDHNVSFYETIINGPVFTSERLRQIDIHVSDVSGKLVGETEYGKTIHARSVKRPQVVKRSDTPAEPPDTRGRRGVFSGIGPGETCREQSDLSREFDLTKPGTYIVEALRLDPVSGQTILSNKLTFTIIE